MRSSWQPRINFATQALLLSLSGAYKYGDQCHDDYHCSYDDPSNDASCSCDEKILTKWCSYCNLSSSNGRGDPSGCDSTNSYHGSCGNWCFRN